MNDPFETSTPSDVQPHDGVPLRRLVTVFLVLLVVWLVFWLVPSFVERIQYASTHGREQAQADVARKELANLKTADIGKVFGLVAKSVSPSVVHIDTVHVVNGRRDEWANLFGQPQQYEARGQGSGAIVDPAGYIVTNNHVVEGAQEIEVRLSDGRSVPGHVIGADPPTDVAVVKIDAGGLIAAEWGDSDALEVGALVWAIGNPFGLDRSVTFGIVSAKNRHGNGGSPFQDFLQTDAAVNPGNSGGPLVNIEGKIVGINTAIIGRAYQGVSFSIPSNMARDVYERLKSTGKVARGWLGVALEDLTPEMAEAIGLDRGQKGAYVKDVVGVPARRAGLRDGDVAIEWNGQPVDSRASLSLQVARTAVGSTAKMIVIRGGKKITLQVLIGERTEAGR